MKLPIWVHQFQTSYAQSDLSTNDRLIPISEAWVKTNDGLSWMSRFDRHSAAVSGIASIRKLRVTYEEQGITLRPWGVVQGRSGSISIAKSEGELARAIAEASGSRTYIVDLEPYYHGGATPQFWRNDLGAGVNEVRAYLEPLAGSAEVWVAPDARPPHLEPVSFGTWAAHPAVTRILPQVYWTDFKKPWRTAVDAAFATLGRYGVARDRIMPVLPGNATPADLTSAIEYIHDAGCPGVSVWQRLNFSVVNAAAVAAAPDPWAAPTPPPFNAAAARTRLEAAKQHFEDGLDELEIVSTMLAGRSA